MASETSNDDQEFHPGWIFGIIFMAIGFVLFVWGALYFDISASGISDDIDMSDYGVPRDFGSNLVNLSRANQRLVTLIAGATIWLTGVVIVAASNILSEIKQTRQTGEGGE